MLHLGLLLLVSSALLSCNPSVSGNTAPAHDAGTETEPDGGAPGFCRLISEGDDTVKCLDHVTTADDWLAVALPGSAASDRIRSAKYLIPTDADAPIPPVIINSNRYEYHLEFMREAAPDDYGRLGGAEYNRLILGADRRYYSGVLTEYRAFDGGTVFGFVLWSDPAKDAQLTCEALQHLQRAFSERVHLGRPVFVPSNPEQRERALACNTAYYDADASVTYEAYYIGEAYGYVKRCTEAELTQATEVFGYNWKNILVVKTAPYDIETVIAASITGSRQAELSHLSIRSAGRRTPNCYLNGAFDAFEPYDGALVKVTCGPSSLTVEPADLSEAEAWWQARRPEPVSIVPADTDYDTLLRLEDVPLADASERLTAAKRFGSKGTNLAVLYQSAPLRDQPAFRLSGFLIPFSFWSSFMETHSWQADLGAGPETLTFAETVDRFSEYPRFAADGTVRRALLERFRDAIMSSEVSPSTVDAVLTKIDEVYGNDVTMVRFRSSSNAEDALDFSGAGLYRSTSVCAADSRDADDAGPSRCDGDQESERTVRRGLLKVWASLWTMRAFEEREWYGIDHRKAAMGILVNTRTKDERADIVAFSENPVSFEDDRYLINAQVGYLDVVSAEPGVYPEKTYVSLDEDGETTALNRITYSSVRPDTAVLSSSDLETLSETLFDIAAHFPMDAAAPRSAKVVFDTEWKLTADDQLIIKQIRPFLKRSDG